MGALNRLTRQLQQRTTTQHSANLKLFIAFFFSIASSLIPTANIQKTEKENQSISRMAAVRKMNLKDLFDASSCINLL